MTAVPAVPNTSYVTTLGLKSAALSEPMGVTTTGFDPKTDRSCATATPPTATATTISTGSHTRPINLVTSSEPFRRWRRPWGVGAGKGL